MHSLLLRCSGLFSISLIACFAAVQLASPPALNPAKPHGEYQSLRALRAHIAALKKRQQERSGQEGQERNGSAHSGPIREDESLDYLEALEAYLSVRAYPNDRVDWEALRGAVAKRDSMAIPPVPKAPGLNRWEFLGPKNCSSPSRWAFGPGQISGRIASAAIDPTNPSVMYAASAGGGVWKTSDGGATWAPLGDGWANIPTSCVVIDPHDPNRLYVGTGDWDGWGGYSQGIERTTDGGQTWTNTGVAFGMYSVRRILVDPDDGQVLTAVTGRGAGGDGEVWRSTDGGDSWTAVITATALWTDVVCSAADNGGNRVYYACAGGTFSQVWKSADRGATWTKLTTPMRSGASSYDTADLAASPTAPGTVYLLGTGDRKLWKSANFGGSWSDITGAALTSADWGQAWYDFYVSCSRNGTTDVLYVGLIDILQSPDGGASWHSFMNGYTGSDLAHVDEHDIVVDPSNPNRLLACCDGGIYNVAVSGSAGSFLSLNQNLGVTEFYWGDFHPIDGTRMIGGAQDNGTPASLGDLSNWASVTGGDGGAALMNQSNPNVQYSTYQFFGGSSSGGTIGFNRTANNWLSASWVSVNVGTDRVAWMGPITMAATNSSVLYVATNYLWKYTDTSNTWTPRLGNKALSTSSTVHSIGVTKADANIIYTGSGDGQLWVTRNGGTNWVQINTGAVSLPNRAYTAMSVRDDNGNDLLVGLSGTGSSHLWRCFDTSSASRTWVDVSGAGPTGLPDVPINAIERDPVDPIGTWYVGTDIGVFKSSDAGSTWQNITQPFGLPNVQITAFKVRNNYLCAVTYGRGMWRLNLITSGNGGNDTLAGLSLAPTAVVGPAPSMGTVVLTNPAPLGGVTVSLSSSNPSIASVPPTVTVPEGSLSTQFTVTTTAVPSQAVATIGASLNGTSASADLTVNPNGLTGITFNPPSVIGGNTSQGRVTIATPAPTGGSLVQLSSNNTAVAQVPGSVTIPAGQVTATFNITTIPTPNDATPTIKATLGTSTVQGQLTVNAPTVQSFTLAAGTVVGGNPVQGTITLTGKAPSVGAAVSLSSSDTSIATVPATVTVPSGATTVNFVVTTKIVALDSGVTITETYHGIQRVVDLLVISQKIKALTITPNPAVGGNSLQGKVTLAGPATSNAVIQLSSSNTALATVPATVTIAQGQSSVTFTVGTKMVKATSSAQILAILGGSSQQVSLTLLPLQLNGFSLTSNSIFERSTVSATVSLNGPALAGGAVIQIASSNPNAATMPTSITIPQGSSTKSFTITAKSVTSTQFTTITATYNSMSLQQNLTVSPITLQSIQLNQYSVIGGVSVNGVVRIGVPAPTGGYSIALSSSYPTVAKPPATITIAQGTTSATFVLATFAVPQTYFVTIGASHASSSVSTQIQVLPPEVSSFKVAPLSTRGGTNVTGSVILTGRAPIGGMVVHVDANPFLAWPATTVTVLAGNTSVNFTIHTSTVSATTPVSLTAYTLSVVKNAILTLTP